MIAGTGSGSGKTSLVCGLISAFGMAGKSVVSFKCGPDFVDPIFHKNSLGIDSYNLDTFLSGDSGVSSLLSEKSECADISIIEGVMGFYDGVMSDNFEGSSCYISNLTKTPVILVVNCKGKSLSIVAEIKGFLDFASNMIVGVILNNVNPMTYDYYKKMIEKYMDIKVLGYLPFNVDYSISERKMGLSLDEQKVLKNKLSLLGKTVAETLDLKQIFDIAKSASGLEKNMLNIDKNFDVKIGIARDDAFSFGYSYNYELIKKMGGEIVWFSPLNDSDLPQDLDGIIIGSGYVTDYLERLSENKGFLNCLIQKLENGIPAIIEGAGNILIGKEYRDQVGNTYKFAGYMDNTFSESDKLVNFGYHFIKSKADNLICKKDEILPVHEFHYLAQTNFGDGFIAHKPSKNTVRECIASSENLYAGMPYLYFCGNECVCENFLIACEKYRKRTNV